MVEEIRNRKRKTVESSARSIGQQGVKQKEKEKDNPRQIHLPTKLLKTVYLLLLWKTPRLLKNLQRRAEQKSLERRKVETNPNLLRKGSHLGLMPLRRPAAKPRPASKAKAKPKVRPRSQPKLAPHTEEWIAVENLKEDTFSLSSTLHLEVWYGGETGEAAAILEQSVCDQEGKWLAVRILGSKLASLRDWRKANPNALFYCCREACPANKRLSVPGVGYTLKAKLLSQEADWTSNAVDDHHPPPPGETENLRKVAEQFGFPKGGGGADPPPLETAPKQDVPATSSSKKKKGKRKVKEMLEKARWKVQGTPLDPHYKRPIRLSSTKKKKNSSSASTSRSASPSSETSEVLQSEHRLRKIAQKLPGYLARKASKEAATILSQSTGEGDWGVGVYRRYYRQILAPKVTSKAIQREMLTLSAVLDHLLDGQILTVADIAAQRLKSLELLAAGSPVELSSQLEILPKELSNLAGQEESRFARREFQNETKLNRQLKGGGKSSGGKDQFPIQVKGKGGKSNSKGGKAQQSKVVEVSQT